MIFVLFARFSFNFHEILEKKEKKKAGGEHNEEPVVNSSILAQGDDSQKALTGWTIFFAEIDQCNSNTPTPQTYLVFQCYTYIYILDNSTLS